MLSAGSSLLHSLLEKPFAIMGVVNVTPDSFYDGGVHFDASPAIDHALRLIACGADIVDIGGESTRPGAAAIDEREECRRVLPVIRGLAAITKTPLSIDTSKAEVARQALACGASLINDISAGRFDPAMPSLAAGRRCPIVLMHSRYTPRDMQECPVYDDALAEVKAELIERVQTFMAAGVEGECIILDPGFGFAKRLEDNIELLRHLGEIVALGFPVLVGTSRKSFIGKITGKPVEQRLAGTLGTIAAAYMRGARIFRVHDVAETKDLLNILAAIDGRRSVSAIAG